MSIRQQDKYSESIMSIEDFAADAKPEMNFVPDCGRSLYRDVVYERQRGGTNKIKENSKDRSFLNVSVSSRFLTHESRNCLSRKVAFETVYDQDESTNNFG